MRHMSTKYCGNLPACSRLEKKGSPKSSRSARGESHSRSDSAASSQRMDAPSPAGMPERRRRAICRQKAESSWAGNVFLVAAGRWVTMHSGSFFGRLIGVFAAVVAAVADVLHDFRAGFAIGGKGGVHQLPAGAVKVDHVVHPAHIGDIGVDPCVVQVAGVAHLVGIPWLRSIAVIKAA